MASSMKRGDLWVGDKVLVKEESRPLHPSGESYIARANWIGVVREITRDRGSNEEPRIIIVPEIGYAETYRYKFDDLIILERVSE